MKTAIILLAAGSSQRLGRPKQLLEYRGKTLLQRSIDIVLELPAEKRIVILGAYEQAIRQNTRFGNMDVVFNPRFQSGMSTSIACGIRQIKEETIDQVLFMLCDQPLIRPEHYRALINALSMNPKTICATSFDQTFGPPCIFSVQHFVALEKEEFKNGARSYILQNMEHVLFLPSPAAAFDVDTDEQFDRLP